MTCNYIISHRNVISYFLKFQISLHEKVIHDNFIILRESSIELLKTSVCKHFIIPIYIDTLTYNFQTTNYAMLIFTLS